MSKETEDAFVKENQQVIRDYLISQFKGFDVTDTPNPPLSHLFIVTRSSDEQYRLHGDNFQAVAKPLQRSNSFLSPTM